MAFKYEKDQAVSAAKRMKDQLVSTHKKAQDLEAKREMLEKALAKAQIDGKTMKKQNAALTRQVTQLTAALKRRRATASRHHYRHRYRRYHRRRRR